MNRISIVASAVSMAVALSAVAAQQPQRSGKELFEHYCGSCHPQGGNIIKPDRNLQRLNRHAKGITAAKDVVARMRKPAGPQMPRFDTSYLSDEDALRIGEYVVTTFR